jgi:hypothetical protein
MCLADSPEDECVIEFLASLWRENVIKLKTEIGIGGISRLQGLA